LPYKFEAGTPNITGAIGLGTAIDYLNALDWPKAMAHEQALLAHATEGLKAFPRVRIIGEAREKSGVLSFLIDGVHPHDIGTILDREGIAIRAGHHCTQPLMDRLGIPGTARASFAFYNTHAEVECLCSGIERILTVFK
jgi:cysteine desulfurase/selenocysteine lyase